MNPNSALAFISAILSVALAGGAFVFGKSAPSRFFGAGMIFLAAESICEGLSLRATSLEGVADWQGWTLVARSCLPGIWFCFSATYARGGYHSFLRERKYILIVSSIVPILMSLYWRDSLFEVQLAPGPISEYWLRFTGPGKILNGFLLMATVIILANLERTFRASIGTARWRLKFLILGIAVIFAARIYTRSQVLLFSGHDLTLVGIESGALIVGCALMAVSYFRSGFADLDLYPSRAVLQTSLTVLLVGGYLVVVGLLAQVASRLGGAGSFRFQAFVILLGMVCLAVVLLSDKARRKIQNFVSRNFKRPRHDFRKIWARFTEATAEARDNGSLCAAAATVLSESFSALSISFWLVDEQDGNLRLIASSSGATGEAVSLASNSATNGIDLHTLRGLRYPIDLDATQEGWVRSLRSLAAVEFRKGGHRICLPLRSRDQCVGVALLADRVNGVAYTTEELDLLECIGGQIAASLLNLRLSAEIMASKELEALQAVSSFFVHDLKNAASTLSLMLANLPVHFDDPVFRDDAIRGIRSTIDRINQLISRAGSLRLELDLKPVELDLNSLVEDSVDALNGSPNVRWLKKLEPLPKLRADKEQLQSVVTNLLLNAREAIETNGAVTVETNQRDGWASLTVTDDGCGMTSRFLKESLFRPFQTTKKKGLGIGMFQSKVIVEAHQGKISVTSEPGIGTSFCVLLPIAFANR